jgi:sugar/nucleoside kinase (ribokinase family)
LATALSAIFIDARGNRTIVTHRDERVASVVPSDPEALAAAVDIVLADNRFPMFVAPICAAARRRGLRIVLDADKRTVVDDPLLRIATHVVFSSECLIATAGCADLAEGLRRVAPIPSSRSVMGRTTFSSSKGVCSGACRYLQSAPRTRSEPAMRCTAVSPWRSPKDEAKPRRCALLPPLPG